MVAYLGVLLIGWGACANAVKELSAVNRMGITCPYVCPFILFLQHHTRHTFLNPVRQSAVPPMPTGRVTGIPDQSTSDYVKLFFENKRLSGGGPVQNVENIPGGKEAVITFEQAAGLSQYL